MYFLTFHLLWPSTPLASMQSLLLPFHIKHILAPLLICAKVKTPKKHVAYIETERETAPRNGKKEWIDARGCCISTPHPSLLSYLFPYFKDSQRGVF